MKPALWLLAAAAALYAQPKLLVNAKTETRSAAAGLEREFRALTTAQPQPAWIAYSVPAVRGWSFGCDSTSGVVHLEPPAEAIVLFRVEANAVNRLRVVSPYCEIDAGGLPVHWLTNVEPAQSVALLETLVGDREHYGDSPLHAIAVHADPAAARSVERRLAPDQPQSVRLRAVTYVAWRDLAPIKKLIAEDPDIRVRERAVSALAGSRDPQAEQLLIAIATGRDDSRLRLPAISALGRKSKALPTLTALAAKDPDPNIRRRAMSALEQMPDGEGVAALIQLVKTERDPDMKKQAMQSLQHSRDPRALALFESILK